MNQRFAPLGAVAAAALAVSGCQTALSLKDSAQSLDARIARAVSVDFGPIYPQFDEWRGEYSAADQPGVALIRDHETWTQVWDLTGVFYSPPVGFTREVHTAVAIFGGSRQGPGRQIVIDEVVQKGDRLTVRAHHENAQNDSPLPGVGGNTLPYVILRIDAQPKAVDVFFDDNEAPFWTSPPQDDPFGPTPIMARTTELGPLTAVPSRPASESPSGDAATPSSAAPAVQTPRSSRPRSLTDGN